MNDTLCTPLAHRNIYLPDDVQFKNYGSYPLNLVSAIAKNGVPIFSPTSFTSHRDAFDDPKERETLDECLGFVTPKGYYFYRSVSPCLHTQSIKGYHMCKGKCNPFKQMRRFMIRKMTAIGITKDGWVILSPFKRREIPWGTKGVDVCNSSALRVRVHSLFGEDGGWYNLMAYIARYSFPYISGCFGPGTYP